MIIELKGIIDQSIEECLSKSYNVLKVIGIDIAEFNFNRIKVEVYSNGTGLGWEDGKVTKMWQLRGTKWEQIMKENPRIPEVKAPSINEGCLCNGVGCNSCEPRGPY